MERKNTGQLSLACTGNLRYNRQPRRLGSVLPSSNATKCFIWPCMLIWGINFGRGGVAMKNFGLLQGGGATEF